MNAHEILAEVEEALRRGADRGAVLSILERLREFQTDGPGPRRPMPGDVVIESEGELLLSRPWEKHLPERAKPIAVDSAATQLKYGDVVVLLGDGLHFASITPTARLKQRGDALLAVRDHSNLVKADG